MTDRFFRPVLPLLGGLFLIGMLAACGDDPVSNNDEDGLAGASNPITVVLEALGDDMTTVNYMDDNYHMTICYEDGECDHEDSGMSGVGGGSRSVMTADSNRTVVGVEVDVRIEDAPGKLIVGESAEDSDGFGVDLSTVFHETDALDPGEDVSFEVGEVE